MFDFTCFAGMRVRAGATSARRPFLVIGRFAPLATASLLSLPFMPQGALAENFRAAATPAAGTACDTAGTAASFDAVCGAVDAGGTVGGLGAVTQPNASLVIEDRLKTAREAAKETPGGGAGADAVDMPLGGGLNVFFSAGAESLTHDKNSYEDGYDSVMPTVTVGADYALTGWLTAGLALNYTHSIGDYDNGGNFNNNSYGPLIYATVVPFDNAFADVVLSYARQDNYRSRRAKIVGGSDPLAKQHVSGDYSGNEYSAGLLTGYDYPIENVTIGPRVGLNYTYRQIDNYKEDGNSGLELRYSGQNQESLQSSFGAAASVAIGTSFGVILPQLNVAWVHEFLGDSRNIDAKYIAAPASSSFSFERESPARNWAVIGLGVSAALPNGIQPFVNFSTVQGNENFVSYGGTLGMRVAL